MKSSTGAHVAPPFVVLKIPPPTLPTNITFGLVGSMTIDRTRPPMLPGPSHVQLGRADAGAEPTQPRLLAALEGLPRERWAPRPGAERGADRRRPGNIPDRPRARIALA